MVGREPFADYYEFSNFVNYGYWRRSTNSQRQASEQLVDKLLEMVPDKHGNILDVACGKGATTERLLRHYSPTDVVGINLSSGQLAECRKKVPECRFEHMDATALEFPEASWDNMICVEAAFHFDTRTEFLAEAHRVLRPGGRLVLSDMVLSPWSRAQPPGNWVRDITAYKEQLLQIGFEDVVVVDATLECWVRFAEHFLSHLLRAGGRGTHDARTLRGAHAWLWRARPAFYVLVMCER